MSTETVAPPQPKVVIPPGAIVQISGYSICRNYVRARETAKLLQAANKDVRFVFYETDRDAYHIMRVHLLEGMGLKDEDHKTSPLVCILDSKLAPVTLIGGGSDLADISLAQYGVEPAALGPRLDGH